MPLPLHPAVVHIPLGVGLALPLLGLVVLWWTRDGGRSGAFGMLLLLQLTVAAGAIVAVNSGELEEERTEAFVPHEVLHAHEEAGELAMWFAVGTLILGVLGTMVGRHRGQRYIRSSFVLATFVGAALLVRTGYIGAQLVYVYDAARATDSNAVDAPGDEEFEL